MNREDIKFVEKDGFLFLEKPLIVDFPTDFQKEFLNCATFMRIVKIEDKNSADCYYEILAIPKTPQDNYKLFDYATTHYRREEGYTVMSPLTEEQLQLQNNYL